MYDIQECKYPERKTLLCDNDVVDIELMPLAGRKLDARLVSRCTPNMAANAIQA